MSHIRWPKYWSFRFNISPSNEHSGLISFRVDWLDLLVVQGTLKSLCQHHSSKASILRCSRKMNLGSSLSVPYLFAFSCCLWGSQGKNTEVVCHILSELSTMTHPSWVALHGMAHSFIELDKAVVHVIRLISFLLLCFSVCLPSDGQG